MYWNGYVEKVGTEDIVSKCQRGLRTPESIKEESFRVAIWRANRPREDSLAYRHPTLVDKGGAICKP